MSDTLTPTEEEMVTRRERAMESLRRQTAGLPTYGQRHPCPKCRFSPCLTEYQDVQWWPAFFGGPAIPKSPRRMLRTCPNCRHSWGERPADEPAEASL